MEEHFILIKGKVNQEELSILKIYTPNARAASFIKEAILKLKAHLAPHTVIVGYFSTPLSSIDLSGKRIKQRHNETNCSFGPNRFNRYL